MAATAELRCPVPGRERALFAAMQTRAYAHGRADLPPADAADEPPQPGDGRRGLFVDGMPVSGCDLRAYGTWWGEAEIPMEMVGGVFTTPESRRHHHMSAMLAGCIADMRERGVAISTITTPFSYAVYRKSGWEYAFPRLRVSTEPANLAAWRGSARGRAEFMVWDPRSPAGPPPVDAIYRQAVRRRYQGAAVRSPQLWAEHLGGERTYAYLWREGESATGYLVATFDGHGDERVRIREMFALDENAERGLLGFVADLEGQTERVAWDAPPDARPELRVAEQRDLRTGWRPAGMFRFIDVPAALRARSYPATSGRLALRLSDAQAPWNEGPFAVEWEDGRVSVARAQGAETASAAMDARVFGQIYCGTISPEVAAGRRDAEIDAAAAGLLRSAFATGRPPLLLESH